MNKLIMKMLMAASERKPDDWNLMIRDIIIEREKNLPEAIVVDKLRAYMDGVWAGPEEGKRLWQELQVSLRALDVEEIKRNEAHLERLQLKYSGKTYGKK